MSESAAQAPISVTLGAGTSLAVAIRSHGLIVDQTARGGGEDRGPEPIELLGAALGSCVALYVRRFCEARGLPTTGLRVEVEHRGVTGPHRIGKFVVRVILPPSIPGRYTEMLERVARSCPVHNTLTHGATVRVSLESLIAAAEPGIEHASAR
jgi:putative redox protein